MPDSTGFGDYTETRQVIPLKFKGQEGSYSHAMWIGVESLTGWARGRRPIVARLGHPRMPPLVAEGKSSKVSRQPDRRLGLVAALPKELTRQCVRLRRLTPAEVGRICTVGGSGSVWSKPAEGFHGKRRGTEQYEPAQLHTDQ